MNSRIIVALDGMSEEQALATAERLANDVWGFKVNDLLALKGVGVVHRLKGVGNVMVDPKVYDIPNTAKNYMAKFAAAGADIVTAHASGGVAMLKAMEEVRLDGMMVAGVTVLTSFNEQGCIDIYGSRICEIFIKLAHVIAAAEIGAMVCSMEELGTADHYQKLKGIKRIVPGIRPAWHQASDDQRRTATPAEAIAAGADFLVIGRPIYGHSDPVEAAKLTNEEIDSALALRVG